MARVQFTSGLRAMEAFAEIIAIAMDTLQACTQFQSALLRPEVNFLGMERNVQAPWL